MSTEIESLELKISSNSTKATKGIEALSLSLTKLKNATSGATFSGVKKTMGDIVDSLSPLSKLSKSNLSSFITPLEKLPKVFGELNKINMGDFSAKMQELATSIKPLADEMQKVANGFSAFPTKIQKLLNATDKIPASNNKASVSFTDLYHTMNIAKQAFVKIGKAIFSAIRKSSDYVENVNLFTIAMGEYASGAKGYAEEVGEAMGIDPGEWMRNQGVFMTLATGFGVAGDRAALMSKNLTQLGYDLSSFFNISYEDAMQKLQSGLSGELEPLRRIGYDLSQAKLEATALELGIDKTVSSMTQAEKAQLRYYAIMTQVTTAQGDMARTLDAPANQLKVFKAQVNMAGREIGNIFIPALNAILPYAIAVVKIIRILASNIANLFGYELPEVDYSGVESMGGVAEDTSSALDDATDSAKKLKSYMLGFDELNVINPDTGGSTESDPSGGEFDFELPEYDFTEGLADSKVNAIVEDMKKWLGITEDIDSWSELFDTKLGDILKDVGLIGAGLGLWKLSSTFMNSITALTVSLGAILLIDSVFVTLDEGLSWESRIEGAIGGALIGAGLGFQFGGFKGAIGGVIIGIGVSLVINGITSMIDEGVNVENVLTVITGVLTTIGGIVAVVKLFNTTTPTSVPEFDTAGETIEGVSSGTGALTTKLKSLATNLAWGIAIIAEVAVAAGLIVGAIWGLGVLLEQVGIAWQPVIDNGGTVGIAIGLGTALLVAIGVVTALLGTLGATMCAQIAIGTAILAEIGVAAALFIAEIWLIGVGLDKIGRAWQPVIDNGETIAIGIGLGTALLVGIGVVTAALGVATVATAGALPLAIGLGTALLVELSAAFVLFTLSLVEVARQLTEELHPALENASLILPDLTTNMSEFTDFMGTFAGEVVKYSASSVIAGIAATIDTIIDFFTTDPVTKMSDEVDSQTKEFEYLISGLETIIPKIYDATDLVSEYNSAMGSFEETVGNNKGLLGNLGIVKDAINGIISGIESMANGVIKGINGMINALNKLSFTIPDWVPGSLGGQKFGLNLKTLDTITIPRFAEGGFPETGQMFIAREAGAEMVGNIGRRTAVANNDQIVSGIAGGVAEANEEQNALLREQNSLLRAILEKDSGVYLDGKNLTNSVEKYQRERGRVLITGGVV